MNYEKNTRGSAGEYYMSRGEGMLENPPLLTLALEAAAALAVKFVKRVKLPPRNQ